MTYAAYILLRMHYALKLIIEEEGKSSKILLLAVM